MANNTLAEAIPQITAQTLKVLRENCVMPRIVNGSYSREATYKGKTIDIPLTNTLTTRSVIPGAVSPDTGMNNIVPTSIPLTLDQWHEAPFRMSDSELKEIVDGFDSEVLQEAVRAIANKVDSDILALYKKVSNYVGTAGTTPFGTSLVEAQEALRVIKQNKAPTRDRFLVVDPFAEVNLLGVSTIQKVNESGSNQALRTGELEGYQALGFTIYQDQNIGFHNTSATGTYAIDAVAAVGATTIEVDNGAGAVPTASLVVGDKFTIAGSTTQHTVTAVTAGSPANADTYTIFPALDDAKADGDLLTVVSTDYTYNLAFHPDAFAFASRPLMDVEVTGGGMISTISDPVSRLTLRFEVAREHKQTVFSVDCLYGVTVLRPELAVVVMG
jgi:hypothetical protein